MATLPNSFFVEIARTWRNRQSAEWIPSLGSDGLGIFSEIAQYRCIRKTRAQPIESIFAADQ